MDSFNSLRDSIFLIAFMVRGYYRVLLKRRIGVGRCLIWGCVSFGGVSHLGVDYVNMVSLIRAITPAYPVL